MVCEPMAVTVENVRDYLDGITEEELTSPAIEIQIKIAEKKASDLGITSNETFILKFAAWKSFLMSKLITSVKIHDISAKMDLTAKIQSLREAVEDELETIDGFVVDSTAMFDDRPIDDGANPECWP